MNSTPGARSSLAPTVFHLMSFFKWPWKIFILDRIADVFNVIA